MSKHSGDNDGVLSFKFQQQSEGQILGFGAHGFKLQGLLCSRLDISGLLRVDSVYIHTKIP